MKFKNYARDFFAIGITTVILFVFVNFAFVYFSPMLVPLLPVDFVRGVSKCYRTLYHTNFSESDYSKSYEIVYGDSFAEGYGDEFIKGDEYYGIFRKLDDVVDREFMIFGRGGYGSMGSLVEAQRCFPLLEKFTLLSIPNSRLERATYVFYEGNDLNNNIEQLGHKSSSFQYNLTFYFPLFHYSYVKFRRIVSKTVSWSARHKVDNSTMHVEPAYPESDSGVKLGLYPQAAAVELTEQEIVISLEVLETSMESITKQYQGLKLQFLYLPSVASSYRISGSFPAQSYKGLRYAMTSGEANIMYSRRIRQEVIDISTRLGWEFCDVTDSIVEKSSQGVALHGPVDWKHFNKEGYSIIKSSYLHCFEAANTH